jgi:hypothetical protein
VYTARRTKMKYLIELLLGWLIGKRNGWTPETRISIKEK